jgi:hypothetical protein
MLNTKTSRIILSLIAGMLGGIPWGTIIGAALAILHAELISASHFEGGYGLQVFYVTLFIAPILALINTFILHLPIAKEAWPKKLLIFDLVGIIIGIIALISIS